MPAPMPNILLVDDDPDFLEINRSILEARGYHVRCCAAPDQALALMAGETPDLVVTDLMMSSLHAGFSLAQEMAADPCLRHVPVIIVTAIGSQLGLDFNPRSPDDLAAMHAAAFFEKPVEPDALLGAIAELLGPKHRTPGA